MDFSIYIKVVQNWISIQKTSIPNQWEFSAASYGQNTKQVLKITQIQHYLQFSLKISNGVRHQICSSLSNRLRVGLDCAFAFAFFLFFFFCTRLWVCGYCSCIVQWTVAANLDFSIFFSQSVHIVHCLWTHKFQFLATFSLKMGPTVLFTHLKIILLQII